MGYYTCYKLELSVLATKSYDEIHKSVVERLQQMDIIDYALDEELNTYDSVKWYDAKDDVCELSKEFKDVMFTLTGEGEESGDIWKMYALNGKSQFEKAKITFDDFDEEKLR